MVAAATAAARSAGATAAATFGTGTGAAAAAAASPVQRRRAVIVRDGLGAREHCAVGFPSRTAARQFAGATAWRRRALRWHR